VLAWARSEGCTAPIGEDNGIYNSEDEHFVHSEDED
jgi:hypothetical protein